MSIRVGNLNPTGFETRVGVRRRTGASIAARAAETDRAVRRVESESAGGDADRAGRFIPRRSPTSTRTKRWCSLAATVGSIAAAASGQNLIGNGGFEVAPSEAPWQGCCVELVVVPAGSDLLVPWTVDGAGVELRGRAIECPQGGAEGRRWVRLGHGTAGGSIEQAFATVPGRRYVCRFRRWVQAPVGPTVPLRIVGPGFSILLQLPSDGEECEPSIAALGSVEFDAIAPSSSLRFTYGGGPTTWSVLVDDVMVVPVEDCDGDGIVDGLAIADGSVADADGDGVPDACDCRGDVTGDGLVDGAELSVLLGNWGMPIPSVLDADGDGIAGGADLAAVLGAWGVCR